MPFSPPRLYRVDQPFHGRLAISQRPLGGTALDESVAGWKAEGVGLVVSMMETDEASQLGLEREREMCADHGIDFVNCPVPDHGIPDGWDAMLAAADRALAVLAAKQTVVSHCFAGMGRSPLMVATIMVRQGVDSEKAWQQISAARRISVPERGEQWNWLADLETELRRGARP